MNGRNDILKPEVFLNVCRDPSMELSMWNPLSVFKAIR
jgi:hypothetical protein